jgi:hypothetical protein
MNGAGEVLPTLDWDCFGNRDNHALRADVCTKQFGSVRLFLWFCRLLLGKE